jgi:nucleoside-diphosphate kinase
LKPDTQGQERTLVIIKPDAVQRQLVGRILQRFEQKGLRIVALKTARLDRRTIQRQYRAHKGKYFYLPLVRYMASGPVVLMVLEGKQAVSVTRGMMGPTFGPDAPPGTIRGDLAISQRFNLVHGSDSPQAARQEIALFFRPEELLEYELHNFRWLYDASTGEIV